MTEQNVPDVTDDDRWLAREWAKSVEADPDHWGLQQRTAARVILDAVTAPSMAEMTPEERAECQWMQCDAGPYGRRGLIVKVKYWSVYVVDKETGTYSDYTPDLVTARPDLPRMKWNGTTTGPNDVAVGTVIESADDPRIAALPVGSILLDRNEEATTKRHWGWSGAGYAPEEDGGAEFGPWTVLHIPKEADQ